MQSIGQLAHNATHQPEGQKQEREASTTVRKLFLLLQGTYGNQFLSKFSTGVVDDNNRDLGIAAAMRVWERTLCKYDAGVIETAADRAIELHKQFPPNLAEFEALCRAAQPRKTHAELQGWTALPAPSKPKPVVVKINPVGDGKDCYRKILARAKAGDKTISRFALESAMQVMGIKKGEFA